MWFQRKESDAPAITLTGAGRRATVLLFVARDCPVANAYAPEIARIAREYGGRGIAFYLVYPEAGVTAAGAAKHARDYGLNLPAVPDATRRWTKRAGATVTPEAAVLAPTGAVLYRGRIDDLYLEPGRKRFAPTRRDLRAALSAVRAGKTVSPRFTRAVGCFIPPLERPNA